MWSGVSEASRCFAPRFEGGTAGEHKPRVRQAKGEAKRKAKGVEEKAERSFADGQTGSVSRVSVPRLGGLEDLAVEHFVVLFAG